MFEFSFMETIRFMKLNGMESLIPRYIFEYFLEKAIGIIFIIGIIWYIKIQVKASKLKAQREEELFKNMNEYYKNGKGK